MAETLTFENFVVTVVRSSRRKNAVIKVDLEGVSVHVPADLPPSRIHALVAEKTTWIERNAEAERKRAGIAEQAEISATLTNGSTILVQGEPLSLRLCESDDMRVVQISDCLKSTLLPICSLTPIAARW